MTNDKNSGNLVGKQLGDYLLTDKLAAGGMAHIYKGVDSKLQRQAAIKVLTPEMMEADDTLTKRFEREARAVGALDHDNIVPIYQYGEQDGVYFIAMKFVQGMDLADELSRLKRTGERMPVGRALRILGQVASALDYAHSKDIIHRDIKPSNILIDPNDKAILTDFGLVLRQSVDQTLGTAFGTPRYISPEQAIASEDSVPQSDIYSLGVVLFEILTGQPVFKGANPMEMALSHISSPPPSPRSLNPDIPEAAEKEILKALEKDPKKRHPTATEFIEAVKAGYGDQLLMSEGATPKSASNRVASTGVKESPTPVLTPKMPPTDVKKVSRAPSVLLAVMSLIVALGVLLVIVTNGKPPLILPTDVPQIVETEEVTPTTASSSATNTTAVKVTNTVKPGGNVSNTLVAVVLTTQAAPVTATPRPDVKDTLAPSVTNTDAPTATDTSVPTSSPQPSPMVAPTDIPTELSAETPTVTPEPVAPINLFYNYEVLAIRNRSDSALDTTTLKFIRGDVGGGDDFNGSEITGKVILPGECVVIAATGKRPSLPKDWGCDTIRNRVVLPEGNLFWRTGSSHESFRVQIYQQDVKTCPLVNRDVKGDQYQLCAFIPAPPGGASG